MHTHDSSSRPFLFRRTLAALVLGSCFIAGQPIHAAPPVKAAPATEKSVPVVRVNVTNQPHDFIHPWTKKAPYSRRALGAVLPKGRVLVTAELVANANYLEIERAESGEKTVATIEVVDYEANLALIKPENETFLQGIKPLELKDAKVGDRVDLWQLESTGALLITSGLLTTVEVSRYPIDDTSLLVYRLTSSLQYREGSFTVPVLKENKLVGILMRYDPRTQNVDVIPAPIIEHFLKGADKPKYTGFPRLGIEFSATRDPQLRRHAGLSPMMQGGVYVSEVRKSSPAAEAGIQIGDVILTVGDRAIDQDGNFSDPLYGKTSLVHLVSAKYFDGDTVKVKIARQGETKELEVKMTHQPASTAIIDPYVIDDAPRYYVLGGLVLQELNRQFLKEWGPEWPKKAPEKFVYFDRFQDELFKADPRRKIVILTQILPSASTIGYEELNYLTVTKVNDVRLLSLSDIPAALEKPIDGFHKIEFAENPRFIFLDAKQVEEDRPLLMKNYGLPSIKRLE